jgi:hypothetical protein
MISALLLLVAGGIAAGVGVWAWFGEYWRILKDEEK